jgi:hypothetical protein
VPLESYPDQLEPENQDAVIWRFMETAKFRDLMRTGELYFCRADLFASDEREGLPPEEYVPILGLNPLDLRHRQELSTLALDQRHARNRTYCDHPISSKLSLPNIRGK